jgi:HEAT repeat protein
MGEYNDRQALFLLDLVQTIRTQRAFLELESLLKRSDERVRLAALRLLRGYEDGDASATVRPMAEDASQDIRVAAMRYLCAKATDRHALVDEFFSHPRTDVRSSALMCAALQMAERGDEKHGLTFEGILGQLESLPSDDGRGRESLRALSAKVIAVSDSPALYPRLEPLFSDASRVVQREAIRAAGTVRHHSHEIADFGGKLVRH